MSFSAITQLVWERARHHIAGLMEERSTYSGAILFFSAIFGLTVDPAHLETYTTLGIALAGLFRMVLRDRCPKNKTPGTFSPGT